MSVDELLKNVFALPKSVLEGQIRDLYDNFIRNYNLEFALRCVILMTEGTKDKPQFLRIETDESEPRRYRFRGNDYQYGPDSDFRGDIRYTTLLDNLKNSKLKSVSFTFDNKVYNSEDMPELLLAKLDEIETNPKSRALIEKRLNSSPIDKNEEELKKRLFKVLTQPIKTIESIYNLLLLYSDETILARKKLENQLQLWKSATRYTVSLQKTRFIGDETHPVESVLLKQLNTTECDIEEFRKMCNSLDYGCLVATLIAVGCIVDNIPMKQLQYSWISLKAEIEARIANSYFHEYSPKALQIYEEMQTNYDYTYCSDSDNFITNFYMNNICNCMCGSWLIYQINELLPESEKEILFVWSLPDHVMLVFKQDGLWKAIESTTTNNHIKELNTKDVQAYWHNNATSALDYLRQAFVRSKLKPLAIFKQLKNIIINSESYKNNRISIDKFADSRVLFLFSDNPEADANSFAQSQLVFKINPKYALDNAYNELFNKKYCPSNTTDESVIVFIDSLNSNNSECYTYSELNELYKTAEKKFEWWERNTQHTALRRDDRPVLQLPISGVWIDADVINTILDGWNTILLTDERKTLVGTQFGYGIVPPEYVALRSGIPIHRSVFGSGKITNYQKLNKSDMTSGDRSEFANN